MLISRTTIVGILLLPVLMLQGCGRKGPLFMSQPAAAKPVPAVGHVQPASAVAPVAPLQNLTPPTQPDIK